MLPTYSSVLEGDFFRVEEVRMVRINEASHVNSRCPFCAVGQGGVG